MRILTPRNRGRFFGKDQKYYGLDYVELSTFGPNGGKHIEDGAPWICDMDADTLSGGEIIDNGPELNPEVLFDYCGLEIYLEKKPVLFPGGLYIGRYLK